MIGHYGPMAGTWRTGGAAAAFVVLMGIAAATVDDHDPVDLPTAAERLVVAWEQSRHATFAAEGEWERINDSGSRIALETWVAQRPPFRRTTSGGAVTDGWNDDGHYTCSPAAGGGPPVCALDAARGSYADFVREDVAAFSQLVSGSPASYRVRDGDAPGCFEMRFAGDARGPKLFGLEGRLCFDVVTGVLVLLEADHGDVRESTRYDSIRLDVSDDELR